MGDVMRTMPWSNSVDVVRCVSNSWLSYINPPLATILPSFRIPGSALIAVLEHSVSQYDASHPDPGGRFLQLSGLIVTFDVRRAIGQRVVEAKVASTGEKVIERELQFLLGPLSMDTTVCIYVGR